MPVYHPECIPPPLPVSCDPTRNAFGVAGVAPPNKVRKRDASDTATRSSCASSSMMIGVPSANMLHSNVEQMHADPDYRIQRQLKEIQQQRQISSIGGDGFWLEPPAIQFPTRTLFKLK